MGQHSNTKCGHGGKSVAMSDPYADIFGDQVAQKKESDTAPGLSRLAAMITNTLFFDIMLVLYKK